MFGIIYSIVVLIWGPQICIMDKNVLYCLEVY